MSEPPKDLAEAKAQRFDLVEMVGAGSYASVWIANDDKTKRPVLLKIGKYTDEDSLLHLKVEGQLLGSLMHPHIAVVHDMAEIEFPFEQTTELRPAIVMQLRNLGEMTTLARKIEREGPMNPEEVAVYIGQIADALDYAHSKGKGIFHRDIKPDAIIVDKFTHRQGTQLWATLIDFGLAAQDVEAVHARGNILGTPSYMPPEIAIGESTGDRRSDTFSLALCALEALTGIRMLTGQNNTEIAINASIFEPPKTFDFPNLSEEKSKALSAVFTKALAHDPEERYKTAGEFSQALKKAVHS